MRGLALLVAIGACTPTLGDHTTPRDPDPSGDRDAGASVRPPPEPSCGASVSGIVRFPDGREPVPNAFVYIPLADGPTERSGTCGQCVSTAGVLASATTGIDGAFSLTGLPEGTYTLATQKGAFERRATITLTCRENTIASDESIRLPKTSSEGTVPHIAVVGGMFDAMENVLSKIGLARDVVQFFPGPDEWSGEPDPRSQELLSSSGMLDGFDYLFLNCGEMLEGGEGPYGERLPSMLENAAVRESLRAFVERGGRLYVTDQAYDFVEQLFPASLDFAGGGGSGLSTTAEPTNAAEIGPDLRSVRGAIHDDTLRAWLELLGFLESDGSVELLNFVGDWAMVDAADAETKVWVDGVAGGGSARPLTTSFEYGCGRVLYTSYHTIDAEDPTASLSAQELILAYLAFEIGACLEEPVLM
jgi:hypothetical protein